MSFDGQKLFNLLPALYRLRDAQLAQPQKLSASESAQLATLQAPLSSLTSSQQDQLEAGGPLQALLTLVAEQIAAVEENLDQLYDDQFIETCAPWVIPYIGDLIGYQSIRGQAPAVSSPRAEVAHTISLRQRKGTVLALEQLARDATGWGAHAVEFFRLLADTQYMNHIRLDNNYSPDLRSWKARIYMNTGFDTTTHKVDVRRIAVERGRYNIQNVGIFLWSLGVCSLTKVPSSKVPSSTVTGITNCFRFSPLGQDVQLFNHPVSQGANITEPATPRNVPDRLRRHVLCADVRLGSKAIYYGVGNSLALYIDNELVDPTELRVCDLSGTDGSWANLPVPDPYKAAIDPQLGRIAINPSIDSPVRTSFYYGFNADMGGGEYPRASTFAPSSAASSQEPVIRVPGDASTIQSALNALPGGGVVEITNSDTYSESLFVNIGGSRQIELRARDGCRPVLVLGEEMAVVGGAESKFYMNGLVVTAGFIPPRASSALLGIPANASRSSKNQLAQFNLIHCTLLPGWALTPVGHPQHRGQPTVAVEMPGVQITIQKSILGPILAEKFAKVNVSDSIIDANDLTGVAYALLDGIGGGGALTLDACTVIGRVHASLLTEVSNSIVFALNVDGTWKGPLWADRQQQGCVRFSYLPQQSVIPRQFECVIEEGGSYYDAWAAGMPESVGQKIVATPQGSLSAYVFRCIAAGTTGGAAPAFPATYGALVNDGTVTWENAGIAGVIPGPLLESLRYGDPGYGKLLASTDDSVRRGADDGGEMGAFHFLLAPQRETDLRVRMQEYLPVGLEFGIFYQT
jgi:hypothetical protein